MYNESFEALIEQYNSHLKAVGYQLLGDSYLAEDVAQEAFLRAYSNRSSLHEGSNIGGWLYTIAFRVGIDYRRKRKRELLPFTDQLPLYHLDTPEEEVLESDTYRLIWQAVGSVDEMYRLPLILFYKHDWPLSRIADHLGLTIPAVKSRLHRSRIMLRAKLDQLAEITG